MHCTMSSHSTFCQNIASVRMSDFSYDEVTHQIASIHFIVKFQNFTGFLSVLFGLSHQKFSFFFTLIFLCRPLTEEEIVDLRERHYDSIAEKQKDLDMKIQKEVKSLLCCFYMLL